MIAPTPFPTDAPREERIVTLILANPSSSATSKQRWTCRHGLSDSEFPNSKLFLNLFTNAADAMPEGGTLTVRVGMLAQGSKGAGEQGGVGREDVTPLLPSTPAPQPTHLIIEISDTGVRIPPEDLPKVMEPSYTTKPEGKGTGLGLPTCRRIVEEHRGTLDLVSEVGQGTTVRIILPAGSGADAALWQE